MNNKEDEQVSITGRACWHAKTTRWHESPRGTEQNATNHIPSLRFMFDGREGRASAIGKFRYFVMHSWNLFQRCPRLIDTRKVFFTFERLGKLNLRRSLLAFFVIGHP